MSLSENIKNRYGSKKGLLRYFAYEVLRFLGCYSPLKKVDLSRVHRFVFICQGNICRSPLAESVIRKHDISTISYGLNTRGGDSADERAIAWASANGYELGEHKTRRIEEYVPRAGDLLIGMEPRHIRELKKHFGDSTVQITLLGLWLTPPLAYLHDPYNSTEEYFSCCEQLVVHSAKKILDEYQNQIR